MLQGVTVAGLTPDSQRYFDYHHSAIDTIDKVNPRELHLGAAALASLIWLVDTQGLWFFLPANHANSLELRRENVSLTRSVLSVACCKN